MSNDFYGDYLKGLQGYPPNGVQSHGHYYGQQERERLNVSNNNETSKASYLSEPVRPSDSVRLESMSPWVKRYLMRLFSGALALVFFVTLIYLGFLTFKFFAFERPLNVYKSAVHSNSYCAPEGLTMVYFYPNDPKAHSEAETAGWSYEAYYARFSKPKKIRESALIHFPEKKSEQTIPEPFVLIHIWDNATYSSKHLYDYRIAYVDKSILPTLKERQASPSDIRILGNSNHVAVRC